MPRPTTAALLLVLAACGGAPPAPREVRVPRDVFATLRDMDEWRAAGDRGPALVQTLEEITEQEKTERVFVTELGRPVALPELRPAPGAALEVDVLLSPWGPDGPGELEVTVLGYPAGRPPVRWSRTLSTAREEGQRSVPFSFEFEATDPPVVNVALVVEAAGAVPRPEPKVCLVRPLLREAVRVAPPAERPVQVLVVTLDTLRRDRVGAYGDELAHTPHLDAFAAEAALFEDGFSVTNVTNPAHTSLFTSLHLKDHKVRDNFTRLAPECPTLMAELARRGLATAAFTASFNFQPDRSDLPDRFDEAYGCESYHERRAEDVNADVLPWLARHHAEPFLAWVHYFDAHLPYDPPHPFGALFEPEPRGEIQLPLREEAALRLYGDSRDLGDFEARYRGEVAYLDEQFGELVRTLRELGIYDESLIVVTADHGECFGEQGVYCEHRGLTDAATAVPLLVRFPGGANRGRYPGLASLVDVYPTILEALGLPLSHPVRGRSLFEVMDGNPPDRLYAEHVGGVQASLRTRRWLGILGLEDRRYFPEFAVEAGRFELYPEGGPQEPGDERSAGDPATAEELRGELEEFLGEALPYASEAVEDERYLQMLERLGYAR